MPSANGRVPFSLLQQYLCNCLLKCLQWHLCGCSLKRQVWMVELQVKSRNSQSNWRWHLCGCVWSAKCEWYRFFFLCGHLFCFCFILISMFMSDCCKNNTWMLKSYSDLNTPVSPCISLQWTRRDGHLVNLPQPLLVRGDIIHLRPGHRAPARCEEIEVISCLVYFSLDCFSLCVCVCV